MGMKRALNILNADLTLKLIKVMHKCKIKDRVGYYFWTQDPNQNTGPGVTLFLFL
jgi:hypothetical protein